MKSKNILSLIAINELNELASIDLTKDKKIKSQTEDLYNNYILPKLKKANTEMNPKIDYAKKLKEYNQLTINYYTSLNRMNYLIKALNFLYSIIDFTKSKITTLKPNYELSEKMKNIISDEISHFIIKANDFDNKVDEYMRTYIMPLVVKLSKEKKIIFDKKSNDEKIQKITQNTEKLLTIIVREKAVLTFHIKSYEGKIDKLVFDNLNLVFTDNEDIKKSLAESLMKGFVKRYDKLDLINEENIKSINFYQVK